MASRIHDGMTFWIAGACWTAMALIGCESPDWARSMNDSFGSREAVTRKVEEQHRQEYVASHSRKSMKWLLAHCVSSGMSYDEVCKVMGEDGTLETHDQAFKSHGGNYYIDDEMYSWKDDQGRAIYLGFRENRLVNFDRAEFR